MNGYGIDFGTTHSVLSFYTKQDGVRSFLDEENLPVPSVVWYSDSVVVGRGARNHMNALMGIPGNDFVRSIKSRLGSGRELIVLGQAKQPHEVAAEIFRHLKKLASKSKHQVNAAVLTIPIGFDGRKRAELRKAASQAGIYAETFIHEPFAALVGHLLGNDLSLARLRGKYVLVFDWGGGTLDITIVKVTQDRLEQVAMGGLFNVAGDKFDDLLQQFVVNKFIDAHGLDPQTIVISPRARDVLAVECEHAKISLSKRPQTIVQVEEFAQIDNRDVTLSISITQQDFVGQIKNYVQLAMNEMDKVLRDAGIQPELVAEALMTGGTCQIPYVREEMSRRFRSRVVDAQNSSTIIAEGAAIISANRWRPFLARAIKIELSDGSYYTVFEKGVTMIPESLRKEIRLICTDNREGEARLVVVEETTDLSHRTCAIMNVPVKSKELLPLYLERVRTNFEVNGDLVVRITGQGEIHQVTKVESLYDICFGLEIGGSKT